MFARRVSIGVSIVSVTYIYTRLPMPKYYDVVGVTLGIIIIKIGLLYICSYLFVHFGCGARLVGGGVEVATLSHLLFPQHHPHPQGRHPQGRAATDSYPKTQLTQQKYTVLGLVTLYQPVHGCIWCTVTVYPWRVHCIRWRISCRLLVCVYCIQTVTGECCTNAKTFWSASVYHHVYTRLATSLTQNLPQYPQKTV